MSRFLHLFAGLLSVLACAGRAPAFIIIDNAGPRELISPATFTSELDVTPGETLAARFVKLASKDKSLSGLWLWHTADIETLRSPTGTVHTRAKTRTHGLQLKVSEPDGLEQFIKFERAPQWEAGYLFNHTWHPETLPEESVHQEFGADRRTDPRAWWKSLTLQIGYQQQSLEYLPTTANPNYEVRRFRNESFQASVTGGLYTQSRDRGRQYSVVFSASVQRGNNYTDLPKVNVANLETALSPDADGISRILLTKSKTVRRGDLRESTLYPITVAAVFTRRLDWPLEILGLKDAEKKNRGHLNLAPYLRITPSDDAGTSRAYGLNVSFRSKAYSKDAPRGALAFPLSIFVERGTEFGTHKWSTVAGVSTVFGWGP